MISYEHPMKDLLPHQMHNTEDTPRWHHPMFGFSASSFKWYLHRGKKKKKKPLKRRGMKLDIN